MKFSDTTLVERGKTRTRAKRKTKKKMKKWEGKTVQTRRPICKKRKQHLADANQQPGEERRERGGGKRGGRGRYGPPYESFN